MTDEQGVAGGKPGTGRGEMAAAEAREWIGAPFLWQQSVKPGPLTSGGCDCKGLIAGVARECGFPEAQSVHALARDYSPKQPVPSSRFRAGFDELFDRVPFDRSDPIAAMQPGDILMVQMRGKPDHVALVSLDTTKAIHVQIGPKNWVKETDLSVLLRAYRLAVIYRWRDV